jgi:Mrp family chromosome partitioning ATPase
MCATHAIPHRWLLMPRSSVILLSRYLIINVSSDLFRHGCEAMIVAILGEKGGTGKTTLAVNLAGLRATEGRDVLLLDADRQGSASYWALT